MKSRMVILTMLVFGMLLSTAGAGLAVQGVVAGENASQTQYTPTTTTPPSTTPPSTTPPSTTPPSNDVLGDQDSGQGTQPDSNVAPENSGGNATQPSRQVEAGDTSGSSQLPFTGFAAVPILLGGIVLLSAGLVLRRRTGSER